MKRNLIPWQMCTGRTARLAVGIFASTVFALGFGTTAALASVCPNAQRRSEQPYGVELPDCRAYEMVSPASTNGQDATDVNLNNVQRAVRASPSSGAPEITYASTGVFGDHAGANLETQYLSMREEDGWSTRSISPPYEPHQTEEVHSYAALAFTSELTAGLATSNASLTSEAPATGEEERDLYSTTLGSGPQSYRYIGIGPELVPLGASEDLSQVAFGEPGEAVHEWSDGTTVPVSVTNTGEPMSASVGAAGRSETPQAFIEKDTWHAVSADGSRVYFTSPGVEVANGGRSRGPHQLFVRVNPEQPQSPLGIGEKCEKPEDACTIEVSKSQRTSEDPSGPQSSRFWGASTDGSKVFFTSHQELTNVANTGLSNRQEVVVQGLEDGTQPLQGSYTLSFKGQTTGPIPHEATSTQVESALRALPSVGAGNVTVSAVVEQSGEEKFIVSFVKALAASEQPTMSANGALLEASGTVEVIHIPRPGADLYEYDLETGVLNDLTADAIGDGAGVQGVAQISQDGAYVYFVAKGALAEGATEQQCRAETEQEKNGEEPKQENLGCNLYVSHEGDALVFIATLAAGDVDDWNHQSSAPETYAGPAVNTSVVSPSGEYLAFMSERDLTGYDNTQSASGECEANSPETGEVGTGQCREAYLYNVATGLACASCNPSGARPVGPTNFGDYLPDPAGFAEYRPRNLLNDGTLIFDSSDALVSNASDGRENVYEYEEGSVHAISAVEGSSPSFFMDASADGSDVFFATADDLVPQDSGDDLAVYDARVDGGFPVPSAPSSCESGEACRPVVTPQLDVFPTPTSVMFSGPGDMPVVVTVKKTPAQIKAEELAKALARCKKEKSKKKRATCTARAHKRYNPQKPKKNEKADSGKQRSGR